MAKFIGCTAVGNGGAGFVTRNPATEFQDCHAWDNGGPGFMDESAGDVSAPKSSRGRKFGRFLGQVSVNALGGALGSAIS